MTQQSWINQWQHDRLSPAGILCENLWWHAVHKAPREHTGFTYTRKWEIKWQNNRSERQEAVLGGAVLVDTFDWMSWGQTRPRVCHPQSHFPLGCQLQWLFPAEVGVQSLPLKGTWEMKPNRELVLPWVSGVSICTKWWVLGWELSGPSIYRILLCLYCTTLYQPYGTVCALEHKRRVIADKNGTS